MSLFEEVDVLNQRPIDVPFFIEKRDSSHFITVATEHSYKTYDCRKLNVIFQGPMIKNIRQIHSENDYVYVLNEFNFYVLFRSEFIFSMKAHPSTNFTIFSEFVILHSQENNQQIIEIYKNSLLMDYENEKKIQNMIEIRKNIFKLNEVDSSENDFIDEINSKKKKKTENCLNNTKGLKCMELIDRIKLEENITAILHPVTYVNKVVLGTSVGEIIVYNFMKKKCLFKKMLRQKEIKFIQQSPIIDVLLIYVENEIILYNIKTDVEMFNIAEQSVKKVSFCTTDKPYLLVTKNNGNLSFIHLEERRVVKTYHDTKFLCCEYLFGEDVFIAVNKDNISLMNVNEVDYEILKYRRFLNDKINHLKFTTDRELMIIGEKEVNKIHLIREEKNAKYKIKDYESSKKFGYSLIKKRSIVSSKSDIFILNDENHNGKKLIQSLKKAFKQTYLSKCGNFVILLTKTNRIMVFGAESSIFYKEYPIDSTKKILSIYLDVFFDRIYISTIESIMILCRSGIVEEKIDFIAEKAFFHENYCIYYNKSMVLLYDIKFKQVSRKFEINNIKLVTISNNLKFILVSTEKTIYLVDIIYNKSMKIIEIHNQSFDISTNNHYICVNNDNILRLYFNNSVFNKKIYTDLLLDFEDIKMKKKAQIKSKRKTYKKEFMIERIKRGIYDWITSGDIILMLENIGVYYTKEIINNASIQIINDILTYFLEQLEECFDQIQNSLFYILTIRGKDLDAEIINNFLDRYQKVFKNKEDSHMKTISYTNYIESYSHTF